MKTETTGKRGAFLQLFGLFFLLIAFVLTSSMFLFLTYLGRSVDLALTGDSLRLAAIVTFGNVFMLSLVCAGVDTLRRKITVDRPVKKIIAGADRVGAPLAVEVGPLVNFFPAEEYHQKYLVKNPTVYCHIPAAFFSLGKG